MALEVVISLFDVSSTMFLILEQWPLLLWLALVARVVAVPAVRVGMTAAFNAGPYLLELMFVYRSLHDNAIFTM